MRPRGALRGLSLGVLALWVLLAPAPPPAAAAGKPPDNPAAKSEVIGLERAINLALSANRGLADAVDQAASARLGVTAAEAEFELQILPVASLGLGDGDDDKAEARLALGVNLVKKLEAGTRASVSPSVNRQGDSYQGRLGLELVQPLLRGLGREYNLSRVAGARFATRTANRQLYVTRVQTVLATVRTVYDVVRQRELTRLARESVERLTVHLESAKAREALGLAGPMDLYRARIRLRTSEDALVAAQAAHDEASDELKLLLALPLEGPIRVDAPLAFSRPVLPEPAAVQVALETRVEVDQARDGVGEAGRLTRVSREETLPAMDLVLRHAMGSYDTDDPEGLFSDQTWSLSLVTSGDVRRTAQKAYYEQSLLSQDQARRRYALVRDQVVREVKAEERRLARLQKGIEYQQDQVHQARGQFELARVKFRHGMASNFDLIEAETSLRQAQSGLISAVIDYIVGTYRLRASLGTLVEKPESWS